MRALAIYFKPNVFRLVFWAGVVSSFTQPQGELGPLLSLRHDGKDQLTPGQLQEFVTQSRCSEPPGQVPFFLGGGGGRRVWFPMFPNP